MARLEWHTTRLMLLTIALIVGAGWLLNPPVYFTNDDVSIRLMLEGHAVPGQPPSGFVLLTHAALGWIVVALNAGLPSVPWWDLVLAAILIAALAVFFAMAWHALGPGWLARSVATGALAVAALPLVTGVQFTISATLAGGAAMLLAAVELGSPLPPRRSVLLMACILLIAGALVRAMAAAAGAVAVLVVLAPLTTAGGLAIRGVASALAGAAAIVVAMYVLDGTLYALSGPWDQYHRYNDMVLRLFEWGSVPSEADRVRATVGWTYNDWMTLQAGFGVDPAVHGFNQLVKVYEATPIGDGWDYGLRTVWARASLINSEDVRRLLGESAASLIVVAVVAAGYARRRTLAAASVVFFYLLCIAIELVFKDLPFRLFGPLQLCLVAVVVIITPSPPRAPSPLVAVIGLGVVVALLASATTATLSAAAAEHRHSQQVEREVETLERLSPSLLVLHSDSFPREHWWRPFRQPVQNLHAITLGSNNANPQLHRFLSSTSREPLLMAICSDPAILVVAEEGRLDFVTTYLRERHGIKVRWEDVYAGSFRAWRCVRS